jgi:hypothetical protein
MRLYIWEGGGISTGYHDDGTLVVLAESVEQAREIAKTSAPQEGEKEWWDAPDATSRWLDGQFLYASPEHRENKAIEREPDRIVEIDAPCVVSFNGGGYD